MEKNLNYYNLLFKNLPIGIGIMKNEVFIEVNQKLCEMTGFSNEELIGKSPYIFYKNEEEFNSILKNTKVMIKSSSCENTQTTWTKKDGSMIDIMLCFISLDSLDENLISMSVMDISGQKDLEREFQKNKEYLSSTLFSIGDGVISCDLDAKVNMLNKVAEHLTGWKNEEAKGRNIKEIFNIKNFKTGKEAVNPVFRALDEGIIVGLANYTILTSRDKKEFHIADSCAPIKDKNGNSIGCVLVFRDLTEEYNQKAKLKESEEKYKKQSLMLQSILDSIPDIIGFLKLDFTIVKYNKAGYEFVKKSPEEVHGKKCYEIIGRDKPCEICAVIETKKTLKQAKVTKFVPYLNIWIETQVYPVFDENGELQYLIEHIRDITDYKKEQEEKERLAEQIHQSQKMEALGNLAGGIAHDFNNTLTGIMGSAELLSSECSPEKRQKFVELIISSAKRAGELTNQLLTFSRKNIHSFNNIKIDTLVQETILFLKHTLDKSIEIKFENKAKHTIILGDSSLIQNSIVNIGINASHAMPKGGKLIFSIKNVELDSEYCSALPFDIDPGNFIELSIRDTGFGMTPEIMSHIFEPFFTTKAQGKGTGMGLSATYGMICKHKGAITVYSEVNKGTVFHLYFPLLKDSQNFTESIEEYEPKGKISYNATILFVDDEELIRITTQNLLELLGYNVFIAKNGLEAIEIFSKNKDSIDLIILDVIMPVMNGRDALKKIREMDDDVPVIISSGFTLEEDMEEIKAFKINGILQKPYRRTILEKMIIDTIGEKEISKA